MIFQKLFKTALVLCKERNNELLGPRPPFGLDVYLLVSVLGFSVPI